MSRTIRRDPVLVDTVVLGLCEVHGITAPERALDPVLDAALADLRTRFGGLSAGRIPHLQAARELYRSIGLDPTRHRPSPEALLRRLLRGDPFPRVHPAVDLGNLWAVTHGLPVGLYDLARVGPSIEARLGRAGEEYAGIRKDAIHVEGRLVLADDAGPFGNPSADSLRTSVDGTSRDLLYVVFAPASAGVAAVAPWLDWLAERTPALLGAGSITSTCP